MIMGKLFAKPRDLHDLTYLLHGTAKQQAAYHTLESLQIFELLKTFDPILAGTIPLNIDIPDSDLDIVCDVADVNSFAQKLLDSFGHFDTFCLRHTIVDRLPTVIGKLTSRGFPIEIFGQPCPVPEQQAVRHMVVEERLLRLGVPEVRERIRFLKAQGLKTEPAFAVIFQLPGDPYQTLLQLAELAEEELVSVLLSGMPCSQDKP
jgi:hypothetical protein